MKRRLMGNGSRNGKSQKKTRKRWKLTMKMIQHHRTMLMLVRRVTLNFQFTPPSQPFGSPLNNTAICATPFNTPIMHEFAARSIGHCSVTFISTVRCLSFVSWCPLHAFIRYQGFQTTQVTWSPTPNAAGERVKMAQVLFETPDLASVAKTALDGFMLKKGWLMSVVYI